MKILTLSLILLNIHFIAFSQTESNPKFEPEPFDYVSLIQKKKGHGVKKEILLITFPKRQGSADTSSVVKYDQSGDLIHRTLYSQGKPYLIADHSTSKDRKTTKWKTQPVAKTDRISVNITSYLPNGKMSWFKNSDINQKGDTTLIELVKFTYNAQHQLLTRTDQTNGKVTLQRNYQYANGNMIKYTSKPTNSSGLTSFLYTYDNQHLPVKKQHIITNSFGEQVYQTFNYTYLNARVVKERYTNPEGDKKDVLVKYVYDANGRIKSFRAAQDSLFREVIFTFEADRLVQINASGNTLKALNREFQIYAEYTQNHEPFTFRKEFKYDDKGNLIGETEFLNEVKRRQIEYMITYW
ncbi:MAG: hypothetical protein EOO88_05690 [Pedobacter sp.]|nr:MAG: hypothetical protein EOO88_05690 [Pedobacter sp.]